MSQEELASKVGYDSRSTINKIELGKIKVRQDKLALFAKALNTTVLYLQCMVDDPDFRVDLAKLAERAKASREQYESDPERRKWSNNFKQSLKNYLDSGGEIGSLDREDLYRVAEGYTLSFDGYCQTAEKLGLSLDKMVGLDVSSDEKVKEFQELFNQLTSEQQNLITAQIKGILSTKE